jgi:putative tricarboxylic transport membrane protein
MVITNKQGSGGAVAYGYVFERKANPYVFLAVTSFAFLGTPLREKLPYNYKNFSPICNFIANGSVLVVKADSPYKTVDDLIADARKRPKKLSQAGASFVSNETMMGKSIQRVKGVEWNFLSFPGEAEATLAVLGGNADFQFSNPSAVIEHVKAGKLRVLLAGAPSRYAGFPNVPAIKEAGCGDPMIAYRGFAGPPDMPDYAVKKLEGAFKKVFETPQFKKYMDDTMQQPFWLSSMEYGKFLDEENERIRNGLDGLGLLKKK